MLLFHPTIYVCLHMVDIKGMEERVESILKTKGVGVSIEWIKQGIEYLSRTGPVPRQDAALAEKIYALFLDSDLHEIASPTGVLPRQVDTMHKVMLGTGIIILQVDEIVNVGASAVVANNDDDDNDDAPVPAAPAAGGGNNNAPSSSSSVCSTYSSPHEHTVCFY